MAATSNRIRALDRSSVHRITSSQVVVDLQTAIKELVENALDAGATVVDVRIKDNGLKSIEVVDNGSGISPEDYDTVALKHHTSKLSSFEDLTTVETFGFRGEALASLCALCESVTMITATEEEAPMGTILEFDRVGRVVNRGGKVARQRGTTVILNGLFAPLPVRRKEFERHAKREYGKALNLLSAYALFPSASDGGGVKFSVTHISETGKKSSQIQANGTQGLKNCITSLWGPKALDNVVPLSLSIDVDPDAASLRKRGLVERQIKVSLTGMVSNFAAGCGRSSSDRQFFFVNKRPCSLIKVQKAFNEVYKTFNATQSPFIVIDFSIPTDACDINVSPDKRTIFLHSEQNLIESLKNALVEHFDQVRSTFPLNHTSRRVPSTSSTEKNPPVLSLKHDTNSSSPIVDNPLPSSDPLPETQPNLFSVPSRSSDSSLDNQTTKHTTIQLPEAPTFRRRRAAALQVPIEESRLSTPPPQSDDEDVEEPLPSSKRPKRRASRSPITSPRTQATPLPRKPTKVVISTANASWSLAKGGKEASHESELMQGTREVKSTVPRTDRQSTLSQFVRGRASDKATVEDDDPRAGKKNEEDSATNEALVVEERRNVGSIEEAIPIQREEMVFKQAHKRKPTIASDSSEEGEVMNTRSKTRHSPGQKPSVVSDPSSMEVDESSVASAAVSADTEVIDLTQVRKVSDGVQAINRDDMGSEEVNEPIEIVRSDIAIKTARFDIGKVSDLWNSAAARLTHSSVSASEQGYDTKKLMKDARVDDMEGDDAEKVLSRVIQKEDFERMEILGQFNLGFIIVRSRRSAASLDSSGGVEPSDEMEIDGRNGTTEEIDDLFIVDQHAADEKYNFETLQQTTRIESQKLLRARPLDLSASDRLVAMENLNVLQSNGFEVAVDLQDGTERLMLVSQPVSKSTVFDMADLSEILHLMQDKPAGSMVRCSKARAMFASRACRKSVMVGHPLTRAQMTSVVRHMGTMDQPWNCPHGRPTMRHMLRMARSVPPVERKTDWEKIV